MIGSIKIGYFDNVEVKPGFYEDQIIEKTYKFRLQSSQQYNDNNSELNQSIDINTTISFIGDKYLMNNLSQIKYAKVFNNTWFVKTIEVNNYPRIKITLGGVYHA